jgi:hypothetical protein
MAVAKDIYSKSHGRANTMTLKSYWKWVCFRPLRKIRLLPSQRPEVEGRREGSHALIKCLKAKGGTQRAVRLRAAVFTATFHFRPAHTDALLQY